MTGTTDNNLLPAGAIPITEGDFSNDHIGDIGRSVAKGWHHPNFDPVAIHLGPFDIRWYSLAYLFGILLGWLYINYANKKYGNNYLQPKPLEALPMWIVFGVILGGRIGYVLFYNFSFYSNNLADIFKVWKGGMSFHGGLTGVIISTFIFSRFYKLQFFRVTDFLAIVTPFGLFFGRLSNFINKELFGKITYQPWGVFYNDEIVARHPSQLYEAFLEGVVLFLILYTAMRFNALKEKGVLSGLFLIFYGIFRIVSEFYREPDKQIGYVYDVFSMGQLLCIPMILAGVAILALSRKTEETK